jgi:hypothetical protein
MDNTLALLLVGFISLVMLFAQLKLFSIDTSLKEILSELRKQRKE